MRATGRHGLHLTCLQADPSLSCTGADAGGMRPQLQQAAPTVPAPFRLGCTSLLPECRTVCKLLDMKQRFAAQVVFFFLSTTSPSLLNPWLCPYVQTLVPSRRTEQQWPPP